MNIDWTELEDRLYELSAAALQRFAAEHRGEVFQAFALVCRSASAEVLLWLNTQGQWKYHGFNCDGWQRWDEWHDAWWPLQDQVQEQMLVEEEQCLSGALAVPTAELFVQSMANVLARLGSQRAFDCLRRTDDFRVFLHHHHNAAATAAPDDPSAALE